MSELVHFEYAPPRSWDQFEELCADLFEAMWGDPALVRHGRAGQTQHGVDIVAARGSIQPVGLQCKKKSRWPVTRVTKQEIDKEVEKAEGFRPELKEFYLLTTAVTDESVQEHVRMLNVERQKRGAFKLEILFWPEIIRRVARHEQVARKHFPVHGGQASSPLLATWYLSGGKLELDGAEWLFSAREASEDFRDWPNGHVIIRGRKTDLLTVRLASAAPAKSERAREQRLELRREVRRLHSSELDAAESVRFICTDPDLRFYVGDLDESGNDAANMIRAVVESAFDPGVIDQRWQKVRIAPPTPERLKGPLSEATVANMDLAVFIPPELYSEVFTKERAFRERFGNPHVRVVSELPDQVRTKHAFPAFVARLRRIMREDQKTVDELRLAGYLNFYRWKYDV